MVTLRNVLLRRCALFLAGVAPVQVIGVAIRCGVPSDPLFLLFSDGVKAAA